MAIIKIENTDQFNKAVAENGKVLVDFYADWCGPCKMMEPLIKGLSTEDQDLTILKVDVDVQQELATQYQIMSIPTLMVFKDGKMDKKAIGLQPKPQLEALVK